LNIVNMNLSANHVCGCGYFGGYNVVVMCIWFVQLSYPLFKAIIFQFSKPFCKWWLFFLLCCWRQLIAGLTEKSDFLVLFLSFQTILYNIMYIMKCQQRQWHF